MSEALFDPDPCSPPGNCTSETAGNLIRASATRSTASEPTAAATSEKYSTIGWTQGCPTSATNRTIARMSLTIQEVKKEEIATIEILFNASEDVGTEEVT